MNKLFESFQSFFSPLSPAQRTLFIGLAFAVILVMSALAYWAFKPDYQLLFGSLPAESAQIIMEELDERNVPYRLENEGRAIYVPSSQVHQLRIQLASEGVAQTDVRGYELFDENSLGMTDFMQQVNRKRALEGELSRSVNSLEQVESSRVHLVLPERTPFQQTTVEASASVILKIARGKQLSSKQVEGIILLIAGSVEGLNSSSVTVLDQNGNRLTDGVENTTDYATGSLQMQLQHQTEAYLTDRGQSMLDRVIGPGNSIVRVSAEHNFDRLIRESDLVDPDSRTIVSEERRTEQENNESFEQVPFDEFTPIDQRGETTVSSNRGSESSTQTRNYDFTRTREVFEQTQGQLSRLSASVLINYKQAYQVNDQGNEVLISEPWSEEEIQEFTEVVRLALGMRPDRGDELTITQIEFHDPSAELLVDSPTPWGDIFRWVLILLTFGAIVALIVTTRRRMSGSTDVIGLPRYDLESVQITEEGDSAEELGSRVDYSLTEAAQKQLGKKQDMLEEIRNYVDENPAEATQVVRAVISLD